MKVLVFAGLRDLLGASEVEVGSPATVAELLAKLVEQHPGATPLLSRCRVAVNQAFAEAHESIPPGAEVAIIPPVSGG